MRVASLGQLVVTGARSARDGQRPAFDVPAAARGREPAAVPAVIQRVRGGGRQPRRRCFQQPLEIRQRLYRGGEHPHRRLAQWSLGGTQALYLAHGEAPVTAAGPEHRDAAGVSPSPQRAGRELERRGRLADRHRGLTLLDARSDSPPGRVRVEVEPREPLAQAVEREALAQQDLGGGNRRGPAETVTLHERDAEMAQPARLIEGLDPLRHEFDAEARRHAHYRAQDVAVTLVVGHTGDERAVDLDRFDGKPLDVVERRVARSEVVEQDPYAESLQPLHDCRRGIGLLHQHALGQLEREPLRGDAGHVQQLGDLLWQVGLRELPAGEVYRHVRDVDLGIRGPAGELAAGLLQHPTPERDDEAGLLRQSDERTGRHQPALRVRPADERLEADDALLLERDDRLVVQLELVPVEGAAEVALQIKALADPSAHRLVEHLVAAAALLLRATQSDLSVREQRGRAGAARCRDRYPDAGAREHVALVELDRGLERPQQLIRQLDRAALTGEPLDQDGKFVAVDAREGLSLVQYGQETLGDRDQQLVAEAAPQRLVDDAEAIQVEVEHRDGSPAARRTADRVFQPV